MISESASRAALAFLSYAFLAVTFLLFGQYKRFLGADVFLIGLKCFRLRDKSAQITLPDASPSSNKERKRLQQQVHKMMSERQLISSELGQTVLPNLEFYDEFNFVVVFGAALLTNTIANGCLSTLLAIPPYEIILYLLGISVIGVIFIALQMEWFHPIIGNQDKMFMLMFGVLGAVISYCLLTLLPQGALSFDTSAAAKELVTRINALIESKMQKDLRAASQPFDTAPGELIAAPLAVCAGFVSAILLAPGLRYGRLLQQLLAPPVWAGPIAVIPGFAKLSGALGFAVTTMMLPLWVPAMTDALLIPPAWLLYMRLTAIVLAVFFHAMAIRWMVQAFLYTGFYRWYMLAHVHPKDINEEHRQQLMQRTLNIVFAQTVKAALQMSLMPALLLISGCIMILKCLCPLSDPGASPGEGSVLYSNITGFLAWWTAIWWTLYASLGTAFFRAQHASVQQ